MSAVRERMAGSILYCSQCGKLISPDEAEAEDFESIGGEPVCPACLTRHDPERRKRFDTARMTRLMQRSEVIAGIKQARAPQQMFPPPGTEQPPEPTQTNVRLMRAELAADWDEMRKKVGLPPETQQPPPPTPRPAVPPEADAPTGQFPVLPRRTRMALWALLGASCLALVTLAIYASGRHGDRPAAHPREAQPNGTMPSAPPVAAPRPSPDRLPPVETGRKQLEMVETLDRVLGQEPSLEDMEKALPDLDTIAEAGTEPARSAASELRRRYLLRADALARQAARDAAESAHDLAARQLFGLADRRVQKASEDLPSLSPWAKQTGRRRLQALAVELSALKAEALAAVLGEAENHVAGGRLDQAEALAARLRRHPEPDFQNAAADVAALIRRAGIEREAMEQRIREAARVAWPRFFQDFDAALAEGAWKRAQQLAQPAHDSALRAGGLEDPAGVLDAFAAEARGVGRLFRETLAAAELRRGQLIELPHGMGQSKGLLLRAEKEALVLRLNNRAEVTVPVERLAPLELNRFLAAQKAWPAAEYNSFLWTLVFAQGLPAGKDRKDWLAEQYASANLPLPAHWTRRFALERRHQARQETAAKVEALRTAMQDRDADTIRSILAALEPLAAGEDFDPAHRALMKDAARLAGVGRIRHIVFQNGMHPAADFVGIQADQINRYYRNAERTDADIESGLKIGSHNDLQRILIRFDGLAQEIKGARVRSAKLELYQLEKHEAGGAIAGVYRLKKAWTPGAGTWQHADQRRKLAWDEPGATGTGDIVPTPEAELKLDRQAGLWRSWDVTAYVKDLAEGKAENLGLLMRVVRDEPRYHARFYPDSDLEGKNEPALRPRLVLEVESAEVP